MNEIKKINKWFLILCLLLLVSSLLVANPKNEIIFPGNERFVPHPNQQVERLLNEPISLEEKFKYKGTTADQTSYPFYETNISISEDPFFIHGFLSDGRTYKFSKRGEKIRYSECKGEVCLVLTDRNLLAIGNSSIGWAKGNFYGEERFKIKMGNRCGFVVTERSIHYFNLYTNEWKTIGLEQEVVQDVSNKNDLASIVTSRRFLGIDLPNDRSEEETLTIRNVNRFEIKDRFINFYSGPKLYIYEQSNNSFTESDLWD